MIDAESRKVFEEYLDQLQKEKEKDSWFRDQVLIKIIDDLGRIFDELKKRGVSSDVSQVKKDLGDVTERLERIESVAKTDQGKSKLQAKGAEG